MKKWEKEILQHQIDSENLVLSRLKQSYGYAIEEVKQRVALLQSKEQTQSVIYQLKYQKQLQQELELVYSKMNSHWYSTINEYLMDCYENGFYQTMYGLHKEGIPMIIPMNQLDAVQMAAQASDGIPLSDKLYQNTSKLAKITREEITRGIAMNSSYADIARGLDKRGEATLNQAYRIVRTEGHRINEEVKFKTINQAKADGADVVKQWDASIDRRTRRSHAALDGQLREVDQPFKSPTNGHTAMYPGGFGIASEDIHCRCTALQRARWALDKSELDKYVGNLDGMTDQQLQDLADKLGVTKSELIRKSNGVIGADGSINHTIKAKNYNQFKKKYQKKAETKKVQLQSQLDVAQQEYNSILSKYKSMDDLLIHGDVNDVAKAGTLKKQISDLQNQLGIKPASTPKPAAMPPSKASPSSDILKTAKGFTSDRDADNYYRKIMPDSSNFTQNELKAMRDYTDETGSGDPSLMEWRNYRGSVSYNQMNGALRQKDLQNATKAVKDDVRYCTEAIEKCTLPEDVRVSRGLRRGLDQFIDDMFKDWPVKPDKSKFSDKTFQQSLIGQRVSDLGFMSTAVSGGGFSGFKLEIYLPAGTQAAYVAPFSHFGSEMELLLQQGSRFEIVRIDSDSNGYINNVVLKLVEQKPEK